MYSRKFSLNEIRENEQTNLNKFVQNFREFQCNFDDIFAKMSSIFTKFSLNLFDKNRIFFLCWMSEFNDNLKINNPITAGGRRCFPPPPVVFFSKSINLTCLSVRSFSFTFSLPDRNFRLRD